MSDPVVQPHQLPTSKPWVEYRFILQCNTTTPLHTGSGESGPATDAELRRNSFGQYAIAGTSIAGALRTVVERLTDVERTKSCLTYQDAFRRGDDTDKQPCGCPVCNLFGDVRPRQDPRSTRRRSKSPSAVARASRVTVLDAVFQKPRTRIVDGVGINRQRRAAQDARKYDYRQILPGSTVLIEVQAEQLSDRELDWLSAALRIIATGQVGLGGRTARGNGFLSAVESGCRIDKRELHKPDLLLDCVLSKNGTQRAWKTSVAHSLAEFAGQSLALSNRIRASFHMAPPTNGTLLIADPVRGAAVGFDAAQRTLGDNPEIPGSSLAGVLRSGAERIIRTLGGRACDLMHDRCRPGNKKGFVQDDSWCCLVCKLFGNEDWASRLSVRLSALGKSRRMPFDHVAIDRFTGGASDQKKFDALAVMEGMYKVDLTIDRVTSRDMAQWMIGLLSLVLRDLHEGRLWLGQGGSKGHGLMELSGEPCWQLPGEWTDLTSDLQSCVDALWQQVKGTQTHE